MGGQNAGIIRRRRIRRVSNGSVQGRFLALRGVVFVSRDPYRFFGCICVRITSGSRAGAGGGLKMKHDGGLHGNYVVVWWCGSCHGSHINIGGIIIYDFISYSHMSFDGGEQMNHDGGRMGN